MSDHEVLEEDHTARPPTVQEALARVMGDVRAVGKDEKNKHQGFKFRGIDAVLNAVGPALRSHCVIVTPHLDSLTRRQTTTAGGSTMNCVDVVVTYTFTGPAGDVLTATVPGEAFDSGDKATPKAMSVAFRTALLQALALPTLDTDPDAESPQGTVGQPIPRSAPQETAPQAGPTPQEAAEKALADAWNSADALHHLGAWYRQHGAPASFIARIDQRHADLTNQNGAPA